MGQHGPTTRRCRPQPAKAWPWAAWLWASTASRAVGGVESRAASAYLTAPRPVPASPVRSWTSTPTIPEPGSGFPDGNSRRRACGRRGHRGDLGRVGEREAPSPTRPQRAGHSRQTHAEPSARARCGPRSPHAEHHADGSPTGGPRTSPNPTTPTGPIRQRNGDGDRGAATWRTRPGAERGRSDSRCRW